ncbi:hypothetical protein ACFSCX_20285 [Bacillus salitolerans]|uniref:DUF3397 domain-containing protein n=1 Tax=Bacillus salitolerans TaxID=1437434 RepID=A0ABW4LUY5_9BACI
MEPFSIGLLIILTPLIILGVIKADRDIKIFGYMLIPACLGQVLAMEFNISYFFFIGYGLFILMFIFGTINIYRKGNETLRESLRNVLWVLLMVLGGFAILVLILKLI